MLNDVQGGVVHTHIHHVKTAGIQHGGHDVLADRMHVAFDRPDQDLAQLDELLLLSLNLRFQNGHGRVEAGRRHEQFRQIGLPTLKSTANDRHPFRQTLLNGFQGIDFVCHHSLGEHLRLVLRSIHDYRRQFFQKLIFIHPVSLPLYANDIPIPDSSSFTSFTRRT